MSESEKGIDAPTKIVKRVMETFDLFHDQHGNAFAWMKDPARTLSVRGHEFKAAISSQQYLETDKVPSNESISAALNILEAAGVEGSEYPLEVRCAQKDGGLMVDMGDAAGSVISITTQSIEKMASPYPIFKRYRHMKRLEMLDALGTVMDLKELLHYFKLKDPQDEIILIGWLGHAFIAAIPHVILLITGPPGATKSSLTKVLKRLVDPGSLLLLAAKRNETEFVQILSHHYLVPLDNLQALNRDQLDILCRASTGEGFAKRALYTDEDDIIFSYKRVVVLNAVSLPGWRGDFMDRVVMVDMARVPPGERLTESQVETYLAEKLPKALNAIISSLSKTLTIHDSVEAEIKRKPRMADFAIWGESFCRALGYEPGAFLKRYAEKIREANTAALENDALAELILKLMQTERGGQYLNVKGEYEGTASDLLRNLKDINEEAKLVHEKELPHGPQALSRWLRELEANLADAGYKIIRDRSSDDKGQRVLVITPYQEVERIPSVASETSFHASDGILGSPENTVRSVRLSDASDASDDIEKRPIETDASDASDAIFYGCYCEGPGLTPYGPYTGPEDPGFKAHAKLLSKRIHDLRPLGSGSKLPPSGGNP